MVQTWPLCAGIYCGMNATPLLAPGTKCPPHVCHQCSLPVHGAFCSRVFEDGEITVPVDYCLLSASVDSKYKRNEDIRICGCCLIGLRRIESTRDSDLSRSSLDE